MSKPGTASDGGEEGEARLGDGSNNEPHNVEEERRDADVESAEAGVKIDEPQTNPVDDTIGANVAVTEEEGNKTDQPDEKVPKNDLPIQKEPDNVEDNAIEPVTSSYTERQRTSLDDLEQWPQSWTWHAAGLLEASGVLLPSVDSSAPSSSPPSHASELPPGRSLDNLMVLDIRPQDIPLPRLNPRRPAPANPFLRWAAGATITKSKKKNKQVQLPQPPPSVLPPAPEVRAYRRNIEQLSSRLKTLRNISVDKTRHTWGPRIVFYDHLQSMQGQETIRHEFWRTSTSAPHYREFFDKSRTVPDDCTQRLILVEDLNPSLIDLLGATFHIPPHVFEAHLDRSGYATMSRSRRNASAWQTRSPIQGYSAITWYRPVIPLVPITYSFRSQLISDGLPKVRCPFEECKSGIHSLELCTLTNIWRRHLNLSPETGSHHKGSRSEYPSGWEERATVWSHQFKGCRFVVLLLDPLPGVVDHRTLLVPPRPQEPVEPPDSRDVHPPTSRSVHDWIPPPPPPPPPPNDASTPAMRAPSPVAPPRRSLEAGPGTAAANRTRTSGAHIGYAESDSPPSSFRRRPTQTTIGDPARVFKLPGRTVQRRINAAHVGSSITPLSTISGVDHGKFVPYHTVKTRSSSALKGDIFTVLDMHSYIDSLEIPTSTLDEFEYFMQLQDSKDTIYDPFRALVGAIHDDSLSLVDIVRVTLRRIREGTLDEDQMQRQVTFWRALLHQLNFSLAEVDQRLREFTHFISDLDMHPLAAGPRAELPSEKLAKEVHRTLGSCMELIDKSSDSLRAEMQIVDSRRSIAEAESISKLTELAFIFIPLSFVASLFSMQIHELDGGVPLYRFVLVAIAFVMVAYAVRLSIRNSRIIEFKNRTFTQIRGEAHLLYNEPIPAHTFMMHVTKATVSAISDWPKKIIAICAPVILVAAVVAAILSPIILLWLRPIDKGFSAVITVLLLLLDGVLVYPVLTNTAGEIDFDPKAMLRAYKRSREVHREKRAQEKKKRARARRKNGLDEETQGIEDDDSEVLDDY